MIRNFKYLGKVEEIQKDGFFWNTNLSSNGVYLIVYQGINRPQFIKNVSGPELWRGRVVNVDIEILNNRWDIYDNKLNKILYIGRASRNNTLKRRLKSYMKFGQGNSTSHYGGRYIWQIKDYKNLEIYFKECNNSEKMETDLLNQFVKKFGNLPFANLRK